MRKLLLLILPLILLSCAQKSIPRPALPYTIEGSLASPEMSGGVHMQLYEDESLFLAFCDGELAGFVYCCKDGECTLSHDGVTVALPVAPKPLLMLTEALTLPESSLIKADAVGNLTRAVYRGELGEIILTLPAASPAFPEHIEYGELSLEVKRAEFAIMNSPQTNG